MKSATIIEQSKQQRSNSRAISLFMPAKTRHDAIAITFVFDLEHDAFVRFIKSRRGLSDDAVKSRAFKATKPVRRSREVGGRRRQMDRRLRLREQRLQFDSALRKRHVPHVTRSVSKKIEKQDRKSVV